VSAASWPRRSTSGRASSAGNPAAIETRESTRARASRAYGKAAARSAAR
jgi:hypothetical protein